MFTLGVIADTHIPDRAKGLPPGVLTIFQEAKVDAVLHAGDICAPRVLEQLEHLAPVYAVYGNRDLLLLGKLPEIRLLEFEGVSLALSHGHGGWFNYIKEKLRYIFIGPPKFSYFEDLALKKFPQVKVVIIGHNHAPANRWVGEQLIFNPGSPCCPNETIPNLKPSVGLLHIDEGNVRGEIVFLN